MTKTPKAYRDDLSKDLWAKRKDANEKIKRIQDNPDFLESHKNEAIKVVKDNLYKELDDARATEEYKDAKSKKQALRGKKKESKEAMKTPQLETKNHKIDEWKSKKEKLAEWWKEVEELAYINGTETRIKILKKELAPGAFVREYQDDGKMPKHLVGEQLFNWKAVLNLGLQDRLPTWENIQSMEWETKEKDDFLKNNFQKDWKDLFPGSWDPNYKEFLNIGKWTNCWLLGANNIDLNRDFDVFHYTYASEFGFSLRLLKN